MFVNCSSTYMQTANPDFNRKLHVSELVFVKQDCCSWLFAWNLGCCYIRMSCTLSAYSLWPEGWRVTCVLTSTRWPSGRRNHDLLTAAVSHSCSPAPAGRGGGPALTTFDPTLAAGETVGFWHTSYRYRQRLSASRVLTLAGKGAPPDFFFATAHEPFGGAHWGFQ